ncbi:hypothetical protein TSUD_340830 [Trifolium subterraneum]|uniref:(+)-neomenthol dehydrogenase n=1 Tax=Trifolium subterraneum TaxID=3900 RepID=A0A2Z6M671_TRISU|nr:hypothetical protein TSUD_340830 [Trifolium subterraneum]
MAKATKMYVVVTGANKGIGFEICKQLASKGTIVIVTARDEDRGLQALDKLKQELNLAMSHNENVIFHHLDLTDPNSIASLANFIKTHFGKLDILVNNAGLLTENEELTEACLKTNYYGTKGLTKALIPLLQFSNSPRTVNVSSTMGRLRGSLTPYEGAEPIVRLALLPDGSPSGLFFSRYEDKPF